MKTATSLLTFILLISTVYAQEFEAETDAGITPDSTFYGLDVAFDKVRLAITLNDERKAELALKYAEERLEELKKMKESNNTRGFERAKERHEEFLDRFENSTRGLPPEAYSRIEARFDNFAFRFDETYDDETNSSYSEDFERIREKFLEKRERLQERKDMFRDELAERNLTEDEIEEILAQREEDFREKAEHRITEAQECLGREVNVTQEREEQFIFMRGVAQTHFDAANSSYTEGLYGRAYGQGTSAWHICRASERFALGASPDKIRKEFENSQNQTQSRVKLEIKCDGEETEIEAEIESPTRKEKLKIKLDGCASREEIVSILKERTSLTDEEIELYLGTNMQRQRFEFEFKQREMMDKFRQEYELRIRDHDGKFEERMRREFKNESDDESEEELEMEIEEEDEVDDDSEDNSGSNSGSG